MKNINNGIVGSTAFALALLGCVLGSAWAEESAEQPAAGEQPTPPTAMTTPNLAGPLWGNPKPPKFYAPAPPPGFPPPPVSRFLLFRRKTPLLAQHPPPQLFKPTLFF